MNVQALDLCFALLLGDSVTAQTFAQSQPKSRCPAAWCN